MENNFTIMASPDDIILLDEPGLSSGPASPARDLDDVQLLETSQISLEIQYYKDLPQGMPSRQRPSLPALPLPSPPHVLSSAPEPVDPCLIPDDDVFSQRHSGHYLPVTMPLVDLKFGKEVRQSCFLFPAHPISGSRRNLTSVSFVLVRSIWNRPCSVTTVASATTPFA